MGYFKVKKRSRYTNKGVTITFGSQGIIYLNKNVMRNHFVGVDYVAILVDNDDKKIAIVPAKKEDEDSFKLKFSSGGDSTGGISARSAIKALDFKVPLRKPFEAVWNKEKNMLEVQL